MYSNPLFHQEATHENIIYNTELAMGSFAPVRGLTLLQHYCGLSKVCMLEATCSL